MAERLDVTYNLPEAVEKDIRAQLAFLIGLAPPWVQHLFVDFETKPSEHDFNVRATVKADYKYRKVYVTIYPAFLWSNKRARKEILVHEAVHVLNAPMAEWATDTLKALCDGDKKLEQVLQAGWRLAVEAATEDTALMIIKTAGWGEILLQERDPNEIYVAEEGSSVSEEKIVPFKEKEEPVSAPPSDPH